MDKSASRKMNRNPRPRPRPREGPYQWWALVPYAFDKIETDFNHLRDYFRIVSDHLGSEATKFREEISALASGDSSAEDADRYYAGSEDAIQMWYSFLPNTIRATVLVAALSLLESALTNLCKLLERRDPVLSHFSPSQHIKVIQKWDDLKEKNSIKRAAKFLEKNFQIDLRSYDYWTQIMDSYDVRNAIVHAGGDPDLLNKGKRKKLDQALDRLRLTLDSSGRIELSKPFLESIVETAIGFWASLRLAFIENAEIGPIYWP